MTSPEAANQDWKAQIIRGRNGSVILPEEFRLSLRYAVNVLGLDQLTISRSIHSSQGLVSNLFTGRKPVRDRYVVESIASLMEQRVKETSTVEILDSEKRGNVAEVIKNLRDAFNPSLKEVSGIPTTTLRTRSNLSFRDLMSDSLGLVIRQSAKFSEQVNFEIQKPSQSQDQVLAALRMAQLFNEVAQVILKEQGSIIT